MTIVTHTYDNFRVYWSEMVCAHLFFCDQCKYVLHLKLSFNYFHHLYPQNVKVDFSIVVIMWDMTTGNKVGWGFASGNYELPWASSIDINLKPLTTNGDFSIEVNNSRKGQKYITQKVILTAYKFLFSTLQSSERTKLYVWFLYKK